MTSMPHPKSEEEEAATIRLDTDHHLEPEGEKPVAGPDSGGTDDEIWYMDSGGEFFIERRSPFFYFNFLACICTFALFVWMGYTITTDYLQQKKSPATSSKISVDFKQKFPMITLCNFEDTVPIQPLYAGFNIFDDDAQVVTPLFQPLVCDGIVTECVIFDGDLPAFYHDEKVCSNRNGLFLLADVNANSFTATPWRGAYLFLSTHGNKDRLAESFCSGSWMRSRCSTFATTDEGCTDELGTLAYDEVVVPAGIGTFVSLTAASTQFAPDCEVKLKSWSPKVTNLPYIERILLSWFQNNSTNTTAVNRNVESLITIHLAFATPTVTETVYSPVSASAFFGSLSGWFGILTGKK